MVFNGDKIRVAVVGDSPQNMRPRFSLESAYRNINADKYEVAMIGITKDGKMASI